MAAVVIGLRVRQGPPFRGGVNQQTVIPIVRCVQLHEQPKRRYFPTTKL
jgi:hypothetical protein